MASRNREEKVNAVNVSMINSMERRDMIQLRRLRSVFEIRSSKLEGRLRHWYCGVLEVLIYRKEQE